MTNKRSRYLVRQRRGSCRWPEAAPMKLVSTTRRGPVSPVCLASATDSKRSHSIFWKGVGGTPFLSVLTFLAIASSSTANLFCCSTWFVFCFFYELDSPTLSVSSQESRPQFNTATSQHTPHRTNKTAAVTLTKVSPKR